MAAYEAAIAALDEEQRMVDDETHSEFGLRCEPLLRAKRERERQPTGSDLRLFSLGFESG